jgi:hypothetical protein
MAFCQTGDYTPPMTFFWTSFSSARSAVGPSLRKGLLVLGCCVALAVQAQWQWLDKDGRRVFSDRPPPSDVPDKSILKRPGKATAAVPASVTANPGSSDPTSEGAKTPEEGVKRAADAAQAATGTSVARKAQAPSEIEIKKKQLADAEAARRKAEQEVVAKSKAENCERARASKRTLDSGVRLSRTTESGQREVFDDKIRAEESARVQEVIHRDCS